MAMIPCLDTMCFPSVFFDFHTHRTDITPGTGIVALPQTVMRSPDLWHPEPGGLYAAGIHPWWTGDADFVLTHYLAALRTLLRLPEVVQLGECGFDRLRGADMDVQRAVFAAQAELSEELRVPMTLHVVRAFDVVLEMHKRMRPSQRWTIHGFRGKPALARQLLAAGFDLSFGARHHAESLALTPPERRHFETDALPTADKL